MSLPGRIFPLIGQMEGYTRSHLRSDLAAGLTVGVMLIPQGMAYALIAGMPPIYGLYASLVPILVYAVFGTSRQLAVGPVAMVSLLTATGVGALAGGDSERYIHLALLLALMVGVLQIAFGLLRFGFLTNFLSHPVLSGFTSAAAIVIGASQLRHLFGVSLPNSERVTETLGALLGARGEIDSLTLATGGAAIVLLLLLRRWMPRIPAAVAVVGVFTLGTWLFGLDDRGLRIVGEVPGGLPSPALPDMDLASMMALLPAALTIALVGFMESFAVAKSYARKHRYDVDANRELLALGAANLAGSLFRSYPTTGGFARTAVNDQAGARTTLASIIAAGVVALVLLLLTGLLETLPNAVLAAIVLVAVASLFDWREALHLWKVDRRDFAMMGTTFAATLLLGIEEGILAGVLASLSALVYETSRPHSARLGRLPGTDTFRNLARYPEAECPEGIVIYRIDAALSFANAGFLRDEVRRMVTGTPSPRAIVFDFHAVNGVDSTGLHQLSAILDELRGAAIQAFFAGVKGPVMDRFRRGGVAEALGADRFYFEDVQAVEAARLQLSALDAGAADAGNRSEEDALDSSTRFPDQDDRSQTSSLRSPARKTGSNSRRGIASDSEPESPTAPGSRATSSS